MAHSRHAPYPTLRLTELDRFKAQGKSQIEEKILVNPVTLEQETISAVTVDAYDQNTGSIIASQVYEISIASLTAERDRLLAEAQKLTDFIAVVPKLP